MAEIQEIAETEINDSGRVLDNDINEWVSGWQNIFRIHRSVTFFNNQSLNIVNPVNSVSFNCSKYSRVGIAVSPTDLSGGSDDVLIQLQFSDDGSNFFTLNTEPPLLYNNVELSNIFPALANGDPLGGYITIPSGAFLIPQIFERPVIGEYCRVTVLPLNPLATNNINIKGFFRS